MITMQVRFCPIAERTVDVDREFVRVPCRGEMIMHDDSRYVVVDVDWQEDGTPFIIAHEFGRPRAIAALEYGASR